MQALFRHEALPYSGAERFVSSCAATARDGIENDARVIVLAASESLDDVGRAIGDDADNVILLAIDEHGRNPARIATMLHTFQSSGNGVPALGVVDMNLAARSGAVSDEIRFAEAVLNVSHLQAWPMSVVCLYDADRLDPDATADVRRCHAVVRGQDTNIDYDPEYAYALYGGDIGATPALAKHFAVDRPSLGGVREFVATNAGGFGLAADRVDDLVLAANEIVTNSLRHGGGQARLAMWFADDSVVCEVRDTGHLVDPLAGRFAPMPSAAGGRGLWLANHLCDLVQIRSAPGRCVVRMFVDR